MRLDSKSQYAAKFKAWNLQKNSKSEFWKGISGGLKRRHLEVSEANVYFNDGHVPLKKLKKELPRYTTQGGQPANGSC
jgi:prepilin-type processing-associated H-X9-DG protein